MCLRLMLSVQVFPDLLIIFLLVIKLVSGLLWLNWLRFIGHDKRYGTSSSFYTQLVTYHVIRYEDVQYCTPQPSS